MSVDSPEIKLSKEQGFLLSGLCSASYVISVYISQLLVQPRPPLWRNDPQVIKIRSLMATVSTISCCLVVFKAVQLGTSQNSDVVASTLHYLGISLDIRRATPESLLAYLMVPVLFLGPIYATFLGSALPFQKNWDFNSQIASWEGFRNYIMAPVTEEVTYRACVLSLLHLADYSKAIMIWAAPCWFGLAHIHHAYENYKRLGRTSNALRTAVLSSLFQFIYTTIFGWLCSFLFLRTGSVFVPISAHIFCNIMGFPMLHQELKEYPNRKFLLVLSYIAGLSIFFFTLFPWSYNSESLYWT